MAHKKDNNQQKSAPFLTPPTEDTPRSSTSPLTVFSILAGLVLLVLLSALVVWILPAKINNTPPASIPLEQIHDQNYSTAPAQTQLQEHETKELLTKWLKLKARAESENVPIWGGREYTAIQQSIDQVIHGPDKKSLQAAKAAYQKALSDLETLLDSKNDKLIHALEAGSQALADNKSREAEKAFSLALAIDPRNEEALQGQKRSRSLDRVLALYENGLELEKDNKLEEADRIFKEAVKLDNAFTPAVEALEQVQSKLLDKQYQQAMSNALVALEQNDLEAAEQAIAQAKQLHPHEPAVIAFSDRLAEKKTAAELNELRLRSEKLTTEEKWKDVIATYQKALTIDPEAGFAVTGLSEAHKRNQLDLSLKAVLAKPERLQDDKPLKQAEQLLTQANSFKNDNAGPILQSQINRLQALITNAKTLVEVTLRSDNATSVEIYHVGRYQPFYEKHLNLRPGKYTVVGQRPGFRDVRMTVEVKTDSEMPLFVFIRCEEPL